MKQITAQEFKKKLKEMREGSIFLDVRTPGEYKSCHIEGTINIPLDILNSRLNELEKYDKVYLQCGTGMRSKKACLALSKAGLKNVVNVEGGLKSWQDCKFDVVKGRGVISIMRQVQISAGSLVLIGVLLGYFYNYNFILLAGFVGAGLLFAGLSGTCAMAALLGKMPWNR